MTGDPFPGLALPDVSELPPGADRPYTIVDMVTTIDGKSRSGEPGEDVKDLGGEADHRLMRRLQDAVDAVLVGAATLRAAPRAWRPGTRFRVVMSRTGRVEFGGGFFDGPGAILAVPGALGAAAAPEAPASVERFVSGEADADPAAVGGRLRALGARRLLILGGSETNAAFLERDLVDELFLTMAPKVKLGRDVPTFAGGAALPRERMLEFALVGLERSGDEVFLRYRRRRAG